MVPSPTGRGKISPLSRRERVRVRAWREVRYALTPCPSPEGRGEILLLVKTGVV
jgi:hypothetical protein